jgi:hypothetical protein
MINVGAFTLLPSALVVNKPGDLLAWEASARTLFQIQRSVYWWIGDMVVYGDSQFGEDFNQVFDPNVSLDLTQICEKVSREFPPTERNYNLSWSHHRALLNYDKPFQRAMLAKAEYEGWSSKELSAHVSRVRKLNEGA